MVQCLNFSWVTGVSKTQNVMTFQRDSFSQSETLSSRIFQQSSASLLVLQLQEKFRKSYVASNENDQNRPSISRFFGKFAEKPSGTSSFLLLAAKKFPLPS